YPAPTKDEQKYLRRVIGSIPWMAWMLLVGVFLERGGYYGAVVAYNNFMQFPMPEGGNGAGAPPRGSEKAAGALGKGLNFATCFVTLNRIMSYTTPIFGAWLADARLGRMPSIFIGICIGAVGHLVQTVSALPPVLGSGWGLSVFLSSLVLIAVGDGMFKPCIIPTLIDQYPRQRAYVEVLASGERVIVDPEMTIQRIVVFFYAFTNLGALLPGATSWAEKYVGFWLAFLIPATFYAVLPVLLAAVWKRAVRRKPKGSELVDVWHIVATALRRNRFRVWRPDFWDAAKPSAMVMGETTRDSGRRRPSPPWTDRLVRETARMFGMCTMFAFFPAYLLNINGIGAIMTSMGAAMTKRAVPNDNLMVFNPITCVIAAPLLTHVLYPALNRAGLRFGRVHRVAFGFYLAAAASAAAAFLQWQVYETSPCGYHASDCGRDPGVSPISIWAQAPVYVLYALSELFAWSTATELAYARAPPNMRAVVLAILLLNHAVAGIVSEMVSPAVKDPYLIWVWVGCGGALFAQTGIFLWKFRWMNEDAFMLDDQHDDEKEGGTALPSDQSMRAAVTRVEETRDENSRKGQ
ncbi:oligopeptide transporter, partial [Lineolata rhizophorae]